MGVSNKKDLIILIGEKSGLQARDNGIAYFTHRLKLGYKNTYYIYDKKNTDIGSLSHLKKNLIIKNSYKHKRLFCKADYLMLNDGYLDVFPSFNKKPLSKGWAPIVYLQHGIISYKKVYFYKGHYNGRVRYFSTSLKTETDIVRDTLQSKLDIAKFNRLISKYKLPHLNNFVNKSDLKEYYCLLLERYYLGDEKIDGADLHILKKLIISIGVLDCRVVNCGLPRHEKLLTLTKKNKNLLFFFTWRDEWTKGNEENTFLQLVKEIKKSEGILRFAKRNNLKVTFYLHEKILNLKCRVNDIFEGEICFAGKMTLIVYWRIQLCVLLIIHQLHLNSTL